MSLMYNVAEVRNALLRADSKAIEHILSQMPEIKYSGYEISSQAEMPYFINDLEGHKVAAFDLTGELTFSERAKIPVILTKNNMIIYIITQKGLRNFSFAYSQFFGKDSAVFTASSVRDYLVKVCDISVLFYVVIIPIVAILGFVALAFKLIVPVGVLYFLLNFYGVDATLTKVIRLCMFSSGAFVISCIMIALLFPELIFLADIIYIFAGVLMLVSLLKGKKVKFGAP